MNAALRAQVFWRAALARWRRRGGREYPPAEPHPDGVALQPSDLAAARYARAPLALARIRHRDVAADAWQHQARVRLRALLGLDPRPPAAADVTAQTGWERTINELHARRVYVGRGPGNDIPVTLLRTPDATPGPPLIILHGTHSAVHLSWGEARQPYDIVRLAAGADIGRQAVAQGYTAVCVELAGHGERRERRLRGVGSNSATAANSALLFGHCLEGDRAADVSAVMAWLLGGEAGLTGTPWVLGHSAGGSVALYACATDERIGGCIASGCIGFVRDTLLARRNDSGQSIVPGLLNWLEMDDVLALIAPRPLLAVSSDADHIWPFDGVQAVVESARPVWQELGADAQLLASRASGPHRFHPEATWPALATLRTGDADATRATEPQRAEAAATGNTGGRDER